MDLSSDDVNFALTKIIQQLTGYRSYSRREVKDCVLMDIGHINEINSNYVTMVLISPRTELIDDFVSNARAWLNTKELQTVLKRK